jgi:DNA repair exonuclease SbcCD nuclease subunit
LFRFIHVSDTHLGYRHLGLIERERDFYEAFKWVIDRALELRVDAVLHAGDMFHSSTPRPLTYIYAIRELKRLAGAGVKFVVAPGNHELPKAEGLGSPVKVLESLGLVHAIGDYREPRPVELEGASVIVFSEWASDYLSRVDPVSLTRSRARVKVGLAHVTLCDALAEAEGVPLERCGGPRRMLSSMVKGGYNYLALGDIHTPWEHRVPGAPPMVYPGSTEYLDVGEYRRSSGGRYVYLVELDEGGFVRAERLKIETVRPWIVVEGGYQEVSRIIESIKRPPGSKEPIVYVKVKGTLDQARRRSLKARLDALKGDGLILDYKPVVEERGEPRRVYTPQTLSLESMLDKLLERCGEGIRRDLVQLLTTLLNNPGDRAVVSSFVRALEERGSLVECIDRAFREGFSR